MRTLLLFALLWAFQANGFSGYYGPVLNAPIELGILKLGKRFSADIPTYLIDFQDESRTSRRTMGAAGLHLSWKNKIEGTPVEGDEGPFLLHGSTGGPGGDKNIYFIGRNMKNPAQYQSRNLWKAEKMTSAKTVDSDGILKLDMRQFANDPNGEGYIYLLKAQEDGVELMATGVLKVRINQPGQVRLTVIASDGVEFHPAELTIETNGESAPQEPPVKKKKRKKDTPDPKGSETKDVKKTGPKSASRRSELR